MKAQPGQLLRMIWSTRGLGAWPISRLDRRMGYSAIACRDELFTVIAVVANDHDYEDLYVMGPDNKLGWTCLSQYWELVS